MCATYLLPLRLFQIRCSAWTANAESLAMVIFIINLINMERPFNATNARIGRISHVSAMEELVTSTEIQLLSAIFVIQDAFYLYEFRNASTQ